MAPDLFFKYETGAIFTTLYFLRNLGTDPISYSGCHCPAFPAWF
jgi:hypothetical protein